MGPLLTEALTKQNEEVDLDDGAYNISMAAANCLSLLTQTVEDLVVSVIMPFVQQNIQSKNWRLREAAIMAFASILDGTSTEHNRAFCQSKYSSSIERTFRCACHGEGYDRLRHWENMRSSCPCHS